MFPVIPIIAVVGLFAAVVKIFQHDNKFELPDFRKLFVPKTPSAGSSQPIFDVISTARTSITNEIPQAPSGSVIATVVVNGQPVTFVKDSAQLYGHYDLAIDFCVKNGSISLLSVVYIPLIRFNRRKIRFSSECY
jgi:hypothetical protein